MPKTKARPRKASSIHTDFDVEAFLTTAGAPQRVLTYPRGKVVFSQGQPSNSVMYIQKGGIKLSVLSRAGKEAVVAMLGPGDFFGEGALTGQSIRIGTATATMPATVRSPCQRSPPSPCTRSRSSVRLTLRPTSIILPSMIR